MFRTGDFVRDEIRREHRDAAEQGYATVLPLLQTDYAVAICDEIITALNLELLTKKQILDLIVRRPQECEMILTGRDVPEYLVEIADLVTEMREVKHYFHAGGVARRGIEF